MDLYKALIDYNYALLCRSCNQLVLDPDKSKGQIYLKGKCPSCGQISKEKKISHQSSKPSFNHSSSSNENVSGTTFSVALSARDRKRAAKQEKRKKRMEAKQSKKNAKLTARSAKIAEIIDR